ncbi:hypothetical protein [Halomarina rubra]|uniref:Yip1 domain-containing protein n=1 Tax=Halomarina rubra TaxID=2071873 RepID=A0ABD6AYK1_9EURY|nr:hypothetical protein [Halomarina rubra]
MDAVLIQAEGFVGSIIGFLVSLVVGALGIYIAGRVVTDYGDYTYAIITALIGSLVWFVVALLVGWIPFLGALLAFVAYLWVINSRYPGGWGSAAAIALVAWAATVVVVYLLALLGIVTAEALGVPGV